MLYVICIMKNLISKPWNFAQGKIIMNSKSIYKIHICYFYKRYCIHISFAWRSIHWDSHLVKYLYINKKLSQGIYVFVHILYTCISHEIPVWYWLAQLDPVQVQICLQFWHYKAGGPCLKVFGELICKCCIDNTELFSISAHKSRSMALPCLLTLVKATRVWCKTQPQSTCFLWI